MDALLKSAEVQPLMPDHDELTVEHQLGLGQASKRRPPTSSTATGRDGNSHTPYTSLT